MTLVWLVAELEKRTNRANLLVQFFFGKARIIQGGFFHWYPPKKLKYGKPRLGESTLT